MGRASSALCDRFFGRGLYGADAPHFRCVWNSSGEGTTKWKYLPPKRSNCSCTKIECGRGWGAARPASDLSASQRRRAPQRSRQGCRRACRYSPTGRRLPPGGGNKNASMLAGSGRRNSTPRDHGCRTSMRRLNSPCVPSYGNDFCSSSADRSVMTLSGRCAGHQWVLHSKKSACHGTAMNLVMSPASR